MNMNINCLYDNIIFISTYFIIILYIIHIHNLISFIHTSDCKSNNFQILIYIRNWFFIYLFILTTAIIYNILSHFNYCINFIILIPHYIYTIIYFMINIINVILIIYFYIHLKSLINKYNCIHLKYYEYLNSNKYKFVITDKLIHSTISIYINNNYLLLKY